MAASQASLELRNNTDANFRLWGKFISDGLAAGGWTKEDSDIDWTTVAAPAQNTYAGYEVWKSPDEAGLTNFYLKLRYGSNNNAATATQIEAQVSWAYSGSGSSLGGTPTTAMAIANSTAAVSTARLCTIAADVGYLALCLGGGAATTGGHLLVIERTLNSSLEPQNELAIMFHAHTSSGSLNKVYTSEGFEFTSTFASNASVLSWFIDPSSADQQVSRGSVGLFFALPWRAFRTSPFSNFLGTRATIGAVGEQVTIPVYGANRTFMILGTVNGAAGAWDPALGSSQPAGLIRFE